MKVSNDSQNLKDKQVCSNFVVAGEMENLFCPSHCTKGLNNLTYVTGTSLKFSLHCVQFLPALPHSLEYWAQPCTGKIARQAGRSRWELTTCGEKEEHGCLTLPETLTPGLSIRCLLKEGLRNDCLFSTTLHKTDWGKHSKDIWDGFMGMKQVSLWASPSRKLGLPRAVAQAKPCGQRERHSG